MAEVCCPPPFSLWFSGSCAREVRARPSTGNVKRPCEHITVPLHENKEIKEIKKKERAEVNLERVEPAGARPSTLGVRGGGTSPLSQGGAGLPVPWPRPVSDRPRPHSTWHRPLHPCRHAQARSGPGLAAAGGAPLSVASPSPAPLPTRCPEASVRAAQPMHKSSGTALVPGGGFLRPEPRPPPPRRVPP